jgi:IS605 OrfB family transposase
METYSTDALPNALTAFLQDYSRVYRVALVEAVNLRLAGWKAKAKLNTHLQQTHGINKRHANSAITEADGMIESAKECRQNHIKQLQGKLKAAQDWLKKSENKLKNARKFYRKKHWQNSKTGCQFPLASSLSFKRTNWQSLRFQAHHKRRYIVHLARKIQALKVSPVHVSIPANAGAYMVGSKDEALGNQICQFDGSTLKIRVPACLEAKHGKYIECQIAPFPYGQDKLAQAVERNQVGDGLALTYRFYVKDLRWFMAVSFALPALKRVTRPRQWGCVGLDINPASIGFAVVNLDGNLVAHGQIKFDVSAKRRGQTLAIIADAVNQLVTLALTYGLPIVVEQLDFSAKRSQLRERGSRYARMLSNFAYSRFVTQLELQAGNRGIEIIKRNPAYSSLLGLVKYARMYGLASDEAAALVIARRGMGLSERLPGSLPALLGVNPRKHIWSQLNQLNKALAGMSRHAYFSVPNWESEVKPLIVGVTDRRSNRVNGETRVNGKSRDAFDRHSS